MLTTIATVLLVVFLYIHVVYHLRTSNDMEVYEIDLLPNKNRLEELCNLRQPLVISYYDAAFSKCLPENFVQSAFELNVVDPSNVAVPLSAKKSMELFSTSTHYTEKNSDFLKDTMCWRQFETNDGNFRPPFVVSIQYDLIFGGKDATTKLKYTNCYRNYFMVIDGEVEVKLSPPRSARFLNTQKDYIRDDFYSVSNAWDNTSGANNDFDKVKFLTVHLKKGQTMFVPAYWWYSFKLKKGCLCAFHYKTIMNTVATVPDIVLGVMQRQNTKLILAGNLNTI